MNATLARFATACALAAGLAGCVVYDPYYPYGYPQQAAPGAAYERYWNAALGAMQDQGLNIVGTDRGTGTIQGTRGNINMRANVVTQADGKIRVEFNAGGALNEDPSLPERVSRAYDARLGR